LKTDAKLLSTTVLNHRKVFLTHLLETCVYDQVKLTERYVIICCDNESHTFVTSVSAKNNRFEVIQIELRKRSRK